MTDPSQRPTRRRALGALASTAGAAAAATLLPGAQAAPTQSAVEAPREDAGSRGYQATAHVRRYYQLARF